MRSFLIFMALVLSGDAVVAQQIDERTAELIRQIKQKAGNLGSRIDALEQQRQAAPPPQQGGAPNLQYDMSGPVAQLLRANMHVPQRALVHNMGAPGPRVMPAKDFVATLANAETIVDATKAAAARHGYAPSAHGPCPCGRATCAGCGYVETIECEPVPMPQPTVVNNCTKKIVLVDQRNIRVSGSFNTKITNNKRDSHNVRVFNRPISRTQLSINASRQLRQVSRQGNITNRGGNITKRGGSSTVRHGNQTIRHGNVTHGDIIDRSRVKVGIDDRDVTKVRQTNVALVTLPQRDRPRRGTSTKRPDTSFSEGSSSRPDGSFRTP